MRCVSVHDGIALSNYPEEKQHNVYGIKSKGLGEQPTLKEDSLVER